MLGNSDGDSVDPVPFLVVTGLSFLGAYSFFPVYFLTLGLSVQTALAAATGIFLTLAAAAYSRLVWNARPEATQEVDPGLRLEQIFYYAVVVTGLFLLLTLLVLGQ